MLFAYLITKLAQLPVCSLITAIAVIVYEVHSIEDDVIMAMKFRAHDTFFIRKGWLSKGCLLYTSVLLPISIRFADASTRQDTSMTTILQN